MRGLPKGMTEVAATKICARRRRHQEVVQACGYVSLKPSERLKDAWRFVKESVKVMK